MSHLYEYYSDWLQHHDKIVALDGSLFRIQVSTYRAIYPYDHLAITVFALPINRHTPDYLATKRTLGDDWDFDILSNPETATQWLALCLQPVGQNPALP